MTTANTYIEPTPGTTLNTARGQLNASIRAILTNFKSLYVPSSANITAEGVALGEQDGMLFRSDLTGALYISDSLNKKTSPIGGNFTRSGIGIRVEESNTTLSTNKTTYEIGELVATLSDSRLYFRNSNTDSLASFIDVGAPQGYAVGALSNVTFSGQSVKGITLLATANVGVNTLSPKAALEVVGNVIISSNAFVRVPFGTTAQRPASPATGMLRVNTSNTDLEAYFGSSWIPIGGNTLKINGNTVTASYTELNYLIGTTSNVQAQLNSKVTGTADYNLTAGYTANAVNDGTKSSGTYTPSPINSNMKTIVNAGAFTIAAPTVSGNYTLIIQVTNSPTANTVSFSGFNKVTGDTISTTDADDYFLYITKLNGFTHLSSVALQ